MAGGVGDLLCFLKLRNVSAELVDGMGLFLDAVLVLGKCFLAFLRHLPLWVQSLGVFHGPVGSRWNFFLNCVALFCRLIALGTGARCAHKFLPHLEQGLSCSLGHSVRPMDHAPCDCGLLAVVSLFFNRSGAFAHILEIKETTIGVGVGLSLHHFDSVLVVVAVPVNRAGTDDGLLLLMVLQDLLILEIHHDLLLVIKHLLTRPILIS